MNDGRRVEVDGVESSRLDDALRTLKYAAGVEPGVGLVWTVWGEVEGQFIRADGPTGTQAWYRAVDLVVRSLRSRAGRDA